MEPAARAGRGGVSRKRTNGRTGRNGAIEMARRSNHYEAAFESYVRAARVPCVAVDEAKRALAPEGEGDEGRVSLKNPDFLLYPRFGLNLVVEVKGKIGRNARGARRWENWVTTDDLEGLERWSGMFGPGFRALLVFAYVERPAAFVAPEPEGDAGGSETASASASDSDSASGVRRRRPRPRARAKAGWDSGAYEFRGRNYWFWAIELDEYLRHLRSRGPAWRAVAMARKAFRRRVRPLREWLPNAPDAPRHPRSVPEPGSKPDATGDRGSGGAAGAKNPSSFFRSNSFRGVFGEVGHGASFRV